jgi:hypothetical protein
MKIARLFVAFTLIFFALSPSARAVVPAPDGGYPGFTTAEGNSALQNLTTGVGNTATGWRSLFANAAGNLNTAIGAGTLLLNTGDNNTATGALALLSNTIGNRNTANGTFALSSNTNGLNNTAIGYQALMSNLGSSNTAIGAFSLLGNTAGDDNTAVGADALGSVRATSTSELVLMLARSLPPATSTLISIMLESQERVARSVLATRITLPFTWLALPAKP